MDVDSVQAGEDYVEIIEDQVGACDVLLAVIGPRWVEATDRAGNNPTDLVRLEVGTALDRQIHVMPVLVGGAVLGNAQQLHKGLRRLARRHAFEIRDARYEEDVGNLIRFLQSLRDESEQGRQSAGAISAHRDSRLEEAQIATSMREPPWRVKRRLRSLMGAARDVVLGVRERYATRSQQPQTQLSVDPSAPALRITDLVHFTVTGEATVAPGASAMLDVWAHLDKDRADVRRRAEAAERTGEISRVRRDLSASREGTS